MSTTANKTKDWLKNQLVTHGVPLPAASAKKEEYQRLYEEQVLPQQNNAEFSSDDDTEVVPQAPQPRANSVAKNSKPDSKKGDGEPLADKRLVWIQGFSDQNLFDALKANDRITGPIVDSTREFYRKMLLDILLEDQKKAIDRIENYLAENRDALDSWIESGLDLHGLNGVTNGNTENGFSDTDEDEATETASRASRSSRASSKRATPTPAKSVEPPTQTTPKSPEPAKPYRGRPSGASKSGLNLNESTTQIHESVAIASTSRSETLLYNRMTGAAGRMPYRPLSANKSMLLNEEEYEEADEPDVAVPAHAVKASRCSPRRALQLALVFLTFIAVPLLGYLYYIQQMKSSNCQDNGDCPDELDALLDSLDQSTEGVPANGN